jgi:hypothetical protein
MIVANLIRGEQSAQLDASPRQPHQLCSHSNAHKVDIWLSASLVEIERAGIEHELIMF